MKSQPRFPDIGLVQLNGQVCNLGHDFTRPRYANTDGVGCSIQTNANANLYVG